MNLELVFILALIADQPDVAASTRRELRRVLNHPTVAGVEGELGGGVLRDVPVSRRTFLHYLK